MQYGTTVEWLCLKAGLRIMVVFCMIAVGSFPLLKTGMSSPCQDNKFWTRWSQY